MCLYVFLPELILFKTVLPRPRCLFPFPVKVVFRYYNLNMYIIKGETDHQPRLDAWDKYSVLVHWEDPEGWGEGRWEGGSGWGIHVNPWLIHVNVWQNPLQYCTVISLQLIKINGARERENRKKKKKKTSNVLSAPFSLSYSPGPL